MRTGLAVGTLVFACVACAPRSADEQAVGSANAAEYRRILPVDEGAADAAFAKVRNELAAAAERRDIQAVFALIAAEPQWSEGMRGDLGGFRSYWEVDLASDAFFKALLSVTKGGGRFSGPNQFIAPYAFTEFPFELHDMPSYVVITSASAPVFSSPDPDAEASFHASYALAKGWAHPDGWFELTDDKLKGYVRRTDGIRPSDARAYFELRDGVWKLALLARGVE